jgi:predicted metal-binding membrane protein
MYTALLLVAAAAWAHVVWMAITDDMAGMDMVMSPTLGGGVAYVVAWGIMMAAMMLPSALPMIGLYAATRRGVERPGALPVAVFSLIYLGVWAATGIPMYGANVLWSNVGSVPRAYGTATILIAAGLFQMTPLKQACLARCRSPIGFLLGHWRAGWRGGLELGWAHAVYCLGCCWALMVVLVVAGAMGLRWVLLIAVIVAAEKVLPHGDWIARAAGVARVLLGLSVAIHPELAAVLRGGGHPM